jgi:hypothetical protein
VRDDGDQVLVRDDDLQEDQMLVRDDGLQEESDVVDIRIGNR